MSTAEKPVTQQNPESYSPKDKPVIIDIAGKYCSEKSIEAIKHNDVTIEVIEKPETLYAGKASYAGNLTDEPEIAALLDHVRSNDVLGKVVNCTAPEWDVAISIDYWQGGAVPRGLMFARETAAEKQAEGIDIYRMPKSLFMRVYNDSNAAKAMGRESCQVWELFGLISGIMSLYGYKFARHGAQEMEYYNWKKYSSGFAYVPVERV